jgi:hypothetical protein
MSHRLTENSTLASDSEIVTIEEIQHFVEQGYLVHKGVLNDDEIDRIAADIPRLARNTYDAAGNFPEFPAEATDEEIVARILCIRKACRLSGASLASG